MENPVFGSRLMNKWFILSVVLLLLNDFIFKSVFHNVVTGKLSDFAGLFAFAYFWSSVFVKHIKLVHHLTAIFFVFFKSSLATSLLETLNSFSLQIYRVVDYTDYIALPILYCSYYIVNKSVFISGKLWLNAIITSVSIFSFVATTQRPQSSIIYKINDEEFVFKRNLVQVVNALNQVELDRVKEYNARATKYNNDTLMYDPVRMVYTPLRSPEYIIAYQFDENTIKKNDTIWVSNSSFKFYLVENMKNNKHSKVVLVEVYDSVEGLTDPNDTIRPVFAEYPSSVVRDFIIRYIRPMKRKL